LLDSCAFVVFAQKLRFAFTFSMVGARFRLANAVSPGRKLESPLRNLVYQTVAY
jgi:hypothetical protein